MPSVPLHKIPFAQESRECQHVECNIKQTNTKLFCCGKCRTAYYCSKECQTKDWKRHKPGCILTASSRELLRASKETSGGYSPGDVDKMIKKWTQVNRPLLSASAVHALASKPTEYLWQTHALCVFLQPAFTNANVTRPKDVTRGFTIEHTAILPFEEAFGFYNDHATNPETSQAGMEMYLNERKVYLYSTLVLLFIPLFKIVRMVPDGYQADFNIMEAPKSPDWEWNMKKMVRDGFAM